MSVCKMTIKVLFVFLISLPAFSEMKTVDASAIQRVAVNGGSDSVNSGTSCILLSTPVSSTCVSGYIGIPNNNQQLLSAALTAKATGKDLWVYYEDSASNLHCPGLVFTPCSLISISIK